MKTNLIIWALFLSIAMLNAQETKKTATVRIKKTEVVNGVEKVTDTSYTTTDLKMIDLQNAEAHFRDYTDKDGTVKKVIIINDEIDGAHRIIACDSNRRRTVIAGTVKDGTGKTATKKIIIDDPSVKGGERTIFITGGEKLTAEQEKDLIEKAQVLRESHTALRESEAALREAHLALREADKILKEQRQLIVSEEQHLKPGAGDKKIVRFIVIRDIQLAELSADEQQKISKVAGNADGRLAVEEIKNFPNPSDGKFTLSFTLPEKGDAEIVIMNIEGKKIYEERLHSADGNYRRDIDISQHPKGAYLMRIKQGDHAQLKKLVLE